ncbi:MAG: flavodoxin family protein [Candidatus Thermoplasmatota archaeon]|nr:flavodoxin family protein [Candidatus Thermoplasmatota archaeon]
MRIGLIVHSQTGNTLSVAEKIEKRLSGKGHDVKLEKVVPKGEVKPGQKNVEFESKPDVKDYDAIIFGAPVNGFSLSVPMKAYMEGLPSLKGKKVALLTTKALIFNWTGGNGTIRKMKKISGSKGAEVLGSGIVIWREKGRERNIEEVVDLISGLF